MHHLFHERQVRWRMILQKNDTEAQSINSVSGVAKISDVYWNLLLTTATSATASTTTTISPPALPLLLLLLILNNNNNNNNNEPSLVISIVSIQPTLDGLRHNSALNREFFFF